MVENNFSLGGSIKILPSDFIVEEVLDRRVCEIRYPLLHRLRDQFAIRSRKKKNYLHFTLVKQNWDTIRALRYIGRKGRSSLKRFGISGMKDKRAITAQRVSLWKGDAQAMGRLKLHNMLLKDFEYVDDRINLGNATGNRFTITIRDIPKKKKSIVEVLNRFRQLATSQGVPNYFGPQRLGGGNANVGRALKDGDLKLGVEVILKKVEPYLSNGNIESIPHVFWYEKKMLAHLGKNPNDYAGALRKIPKKILRLYTHAYQSQLFNEKLYTALQGSRAPESLTIEGFDTSKIPELRTFPITRRTFLTAKDFKILKARDGLAIIQFILGKGEYATTFLSSLITC